MATVLLLAGPARAGASVCAELAPSLKVTRLQGLFANRDEAEHVTHQMPNLDEEFRKHGLVLLGVAGMGPSVVFSRTRISTWDELRKARLWRWDLDPVAWRQDQLMGLAVVPMSVEDASGAFEAGKLDGFVALAASALAFQWHSLAPNILPLEFDYLDACVLIAESSFQALPSETQKVVRGAAAKLQRRMELVGREVDRPVMPGALVGHGIRAWPVSHELRARSAAAEEEAGAGGLGGGRFPGWGGGDGGGGDEGAEEREQGGDDGEGAVLFEAAQGLVAVAEPDGGDAGAVGAGGGFVERVDARIAHAPVDHARRVGDGRVERDRRCHRGREREGAQLVDGARDAGRDRDGGAAE